MNYILGIDQGSSNTRAAVSDETGNLIGYYKTDGACHSIHGMDKAMGMIRDASLGALQMAGLRSCDVSILYSGMTGADFPDEYELLHDELVNLQICMHVVVKNDCIAALRGGTMKNYGAIVAAGSGCNCAIISPTGEEFIYQYFVEDAMQGGGAFSRKIIDVIYQAETFRVPETRLTKSVLTKLGFPDVMTLLRNDVEKKITQINGLGLFPLFLKRPSQEI
jgi:N-acetylglucosamine kinase-like BadF-type ATPase